MNAGERSFYSYPRLPRIVMCISGKRMMRPETDRRIYGPVFRFTEEQLPVQGVSTVETSLLSLISQTPAPTEEDTRQVHQIERTSIRLSIHKIQAVSVDGINHKKNRDRCYELTGSFTG